MTHMNTRFHAPKQNIKSAVAFWLAITATALSAANLFLVFYLR